MLYRGINKKADVANSGRILPKGKSVAVAAKLDAQWHLDGKFKIGTCETNSARAHHIETGLYGGCGISCSRSEEKAVEFATNGFNEEGYVYVIDETLLASANVVAHEFPDPLYPDEHEVTLIEQSGGALPPEVIIEKYAVNSEGKRI